MPSIDKEFKFENLRALVIDDETIIIRMVAAALRELGFSQIKMAKNGQDAMEHFYDGECRFDLIICDWMMPNMNGLEFLQFIRSKFPNVPFLMLTGKITKEAILEAKEAGVSAYIAKPFSSDQLNKKVKTLIRRSVDGESGETAWLATMGT